MAPAQILAPSDAAIAAAAAALRAGRLVAFPTETVYGLGADATNDAAVAAIFAAKARPRINPLIVHVADAAAAETLVAFDARARALAAQFWPGPLTLVLPRHAACPLSRLVSAGLETTAVRVPGHATARRMIAAAGVPIAAPSANRSGGISPTRAEHAARTLGDDVAIIIDDGPCPVGVESTVVDLSGPMPRLLRPGGVTREALELALGALALTPLADGPPTLDPLAGGDDGAAPRSPGLVGRHYAPATPLRLEAREVAADEALLAFGDDVPTGAAATRNLSPTGDVTEAAANLFAMLHELDSGDFRTIAVVPLPERGLGAAINDRLRRAAAGA